jgi:hypothetical protein
MDRGSVLVSGEPDAVLGSREVAEAFLGTDPLARSRSAQVATATDTEVETT